MIAACAGVEQLLGHPDQAHRRLTEAFAELPDRRSPAAVNLLIQLSLDAFYSGRWDEMSRYAIEGLETARELGDRPLTAAAGALAAFATSCIGPVDEARRYHDEAAALVDAQPDEELATRLDAVAWLSASEFYLDLYEDGIAHGRRGLALARATGQGDLIPALVQALANMLFTTGRVTEANELLDGSVESARLSRNALGLAWSLMNRGYSALIEGDLKTATATSAEALELTRAFEGSVERLGGRSCGRHRRGGRARGGGAGDHGRAMRRDRGRSDRGRLEVEHARLGDAGPAPARPSGGGGADRDAGRGEGARLPPAACARGRRGGKGPRRTRRRRSRRGGRGPR